jgi:hypothetical protein
MFPIRGAYGGLMKNLLLISCFIAAAAVYAQTESPVPRMDAAVKSLAGELHKKLIEEKAGKIAVGQFTCRDTIVPFSAYWTNQLSEELSNMPGRPYTVLSSGPSGADRTISGEIIEAADIIRIYTRLVRSEDRVIEAGLHSDFLSSDTLKAMLNPADSPSGSSSVPSDRWEPDSWDNPVSYEIGADESAPVMDRTLHNRSDEDFFILLPDSDGRLVMETTGSIDTLMYFYNADTRDLLSEDDDSGSGYNARIRYSVQAGKRYIAKVKGYDGETGHYGFRAYLAAPVLLPPDEFEPDDDSSSASPIEIGASQQHTFHTGNDVDWVKFEVKQSGRYIIRARGVNSNRLDTYIELFDSDMNSIGEDDDGGDNLDSRLSIRLNTGLYYLKIRCLDDEPDQPYTVSIQAE